MNEFASRPPAMMQTKTFYEAAADSRMVEASAAAKLALKAADFAGYGSEVQGSIQQAIDALDYAHRVATGQT